MTERLDHTPASAPVRGPRELIFEVGAPESRCVEAPPLDVPLHWQYARAALGVVDALGRALVAAARTALRPG